MLTANVALRARHLKFKQTNYPRVTATLLLTSALTACGGGGGGSPAAPPPSDSSNNTSQVPDNRIRVAYFRDTDGNPDTIGGQLIIETEAVSSISSVSTESIAVYWADNQGSKIGNAWLESSANNLDTISVPQGSLAPDNATGLILYLKNDAGEALQGQRVKFNDYVSNANLSGPGGNKQVSWNYGQDRPTITIQRTEEQGGMCILDNGLVSVIDMNNTDDLVWKNSNKETANTINDIDFPPYEFLCNENPVNTERAILDGDDEVWTYSTLNDAMFYGTIVYDTFLKYLGEPPLDDKLRLRVHYGKNFESNAFWDGAYANFQDGYGSHYSLATLDIIAHEVGHGVLNRISDLNSFEHEISTDARTLHEAFSDIAGTMAKYEFTGELNWIHGEESSGRIRTLNKIQTESGAIDSFLDYDDAEDNFYLRNGMITYPFYLLANRWDIESTFKVYLNAARNCWTAMTTLPEAAQCIEQQAVLAGHSREDVINAFKEVKINLNETNTLSHFEFKPYKLRTEFVDDSRTQNQITDWHWDFGDGNTSNEINPEHTYSTSGDYEVTLTVTDQTGDQDQFTRPVTVSDQYCSLFSSSNDLDKISDVIIDGNDLNFDPSQSDYTSNVININDASNVSIDIQSNVVATSHSTNWAIYIDLNDDGIYGDSAEEKILDIGVDDGQPYALTTTLDLSTLTNDNSPKFMRIIGGHVVVDPCTHAIGQALDLRINW